MMKHISMLAVLRSGLPALAIVGIVHARTATPAVFALQEREALGGVWELNRDRSRLADADGSGGDTALAPGGRGAGEDVS